MKLEFTSPEMERKPLKSPSLRVNSSVRRTQPLSLEALG